MVRFLADQDLRGAIIRGLLQQYPHLDVLRAADVGLSGQDDPILLEWAAREGRIVLTHDRRTMPIFAHDRVAAGLPMPGIVVIRQILSVRRALDDLRILIECSHDYEWADQVRYIPLHHGTHS